MSKVIDLSGQNFDRLFVEELIGSKYTHRLYRCLCDCGNYKEVTAGNLRRGYVRSCGCLYKDSAIRNGINSYQDYNDLSMSYCNSLKSGAKRRGFFFNISIEYAWELFELQNRKCYFTGENLSLTRHFIKEKQNGSLDRINNLIGYEVGNVRWVKKDINMLKWDLKQEELLRICEMVANKNRESIPPISTV